MMVVKDYIESKIHTFFLEDGSLQRVQCVKSDRFDRFSFMKMHYDARCFERLCQLYDSFIVRKYALILGTIVLFYLPEDLECPVSEDTEKGKIYDPLTVLSLRFKRDACLKNGKISFRNEETAALFGMLQEKGALFVTRGKRNYLSFLPVAAKAGFLSSEVPEAALRCNSSFFIMDQLDCATAFDQIYTPVGLKVKDGVILSPPLFDREALMVDKSGKVFIGRPSLKQIGVIVDGKVYHHNQNAYFFSRPKHSRSKRGGSDLLIIGNHIQAVLNGGGSAVPAGGFILHLKEPPEIRNREVSFCGMEDLSFALQVGNSVIADGKRTQRFVSPFYHLLNPFEAPYPPSLYPKGFKKDRAPRIVLGEGSKGEPMLLWFEGAGKFGYEKGKESAGVSLYETAEICEKLGMRNGIHLDGGGSAQILVNGERGLMLSDRDPKDFSQIERAIPEGLMIL